MNTTQHFEIPKPLKAWLIVHFIVDISFALPLFFVPAWFMHFLGWKTTDPIMARMVAAALFGIGGESLFAVKLGKDAFKAMLNLKIIWSIAAVLGFIIALIEGDFGYSLVGFGLLAIFAGFNVLWIYWKVKLEK